MYKLIIAEDEAIVREGFSKLINYEELGFELVGICENGLDAWDICRLDPPDLIITDINMPYMNGLELCEKVSSISRDTKFVIVTGYDDFQYCKRAISLKVEEYVLKPITRKSFMDILSRVKADLDIVSASNSALKNLMIESHTIKRSKHLDEYTKLLNCFDKKSSKHQLLSLQFFSENANYGLLLIEHTGLEDYATNFIVSNILEDLRHDSAYGDKPSFIVFPAPADRLAVIACAQLHSQLTKLMDKLCSYILHELSELLKLNFYIGMFPLVSKLNFAAAYAGCLSAIEHRLFHENTNIFSAEKFTSKTIVFPYIKHDDAILSAIKTCDQSLLHKHIESMVVDAKETLNPHDFLAYVRQLSGRMIEIARDNLISQDNSMQLDLQPISTSGKTLSQITRELLQIGDNCTSVMSHTCDNYGYLISQKAIAFIKENYSDYTINLLSITKLLNVSVSYFSNVFKANTKTTFIEYLNNFRIDKAKALLLTTWFKTYEIAEKVGIINANYFGFVFKKATGLTPKEFRVASGKEVQGG